MGAQPPGGVSPAKRAAELHRQIQAKFAEAEQAMSSYELVEAVAFTATSNELRYAGRHLIDGLVQFSTSPADAIENFESALKHCRRGCYDVHAAWIIAYNRRAHHFGNKFDRVQISTVLPDWIQWRRDFDEAADLTAKYRAGTRGSAAEQHKREEQADRARELACRLRDRWQLMDAASEELFKLQVAAEKADREADEKSALSRRRYTLTTAVAVAAALIALLQFMSKDEPPGAVRGAGVAPASAVPGAAAEPSP